MKTVKVSVEGVSPIAFSKQYEVSKLEKESAADYEKRTWRNRVHVTKEGEVIITAMMWKNMLAEIGKHLGEKIPGKGNKTYTKYFESGILVGDPSPLGVHRDDVDGEWLFVPSDGVKGSGKRVWKCFPIIHNWTADALIYVLDETITKEIFERYMREAGKFIGVGFFRPGRGGDKGRFNVIKFEWVK